MQARIWWGSSVVMVTLGLTLPAWTGAQQQTSSRGDWPCAARLDPSYFQVAEGSGGHLLLLAPWEIGDSAPLLTELGNHRQTIFRMAGRIAAGLQEFRVTMDPTVESVVFSISVQCLQTADVVGPSGASVVVGEGVADLSNFRAQRMVVVKRPEPGVWTLRASGSGVAAVVVQARSELGITRVQFAPAGSTTFTYLPAKGTENLISIGITGGPTEVQASLVDAAFRRIAPLTRTADDAEGSYVARFAAVPQAFRVLVEGKTADGAPFQRVHAPLFSGTR